MFLSRYLERVSQAPVVFGLQGLKSSQLLEQLAGGWNPAIQASISQRSPSLEVMTRRFALMLDRNRSHSREGRRPLIVSDHGLHSFLRFLINPSIDEIQSPREILDWAESENLYTVFLYRDIRAVANSLAHFLASKKSFLLGLESLDAARELVVEHYAPVLAEQTRIWTSSPSDRVLCLSYEQLMQNPGEWIDSICARGGLPCDRTMLTDPAGSYRSWTYRADGSGWDGTFSDRQKAVLTAMAEGVAQRC